MSTFKCWDTAERLTGNPAARSKFGGGWSDVDRNGCDTRNDILRRDLTGTTVGAGGCVVLTGALAAPYGGTKIGFVRGVTTSSEVQIDHVVALGDAWVKEPKRSRPPSGPRWPTTRSTCSR